MLSVGQNAPRLSPSQDIRIKSKPPSGSVMYITDSTSQLGALSVNRGADGGAPLRIAWRPTWPKNQLTEIEETRAFAQAIIETVREPVLVLAQDLDVTTPNPPSYT